MSWATSSRHAPWLAPPRDPCLGLYLTPFCLPANNWLLATLAVTFYKGRQNRLAC